MTSSRLKTTPRKNAKRDPAPLLVTQSLASTLLRLYDYPHPTRPGHIIRGYDKQHALRTARMCAAVALRLGHPRERVIDYQIACILHDLGRAGLDRKLFGRIWSWARDHKIPTRPREWRAVFPQTTYGRETEAFLKHYTTDLEQTGIQMDAWAKEQVEMRLGFSRRMNRRLRETKPHLASLGITWAPWMTRITLYYYYPEKMANDAPWIHQLGEVLVACEQFEAYNNHQRGRDYYCRNEEKLNAAIEYLYTLRQEGIISAKVVNTLVTLAAEGAFDQIIMQARKLPLSRREHTNLRHLASTGIA